MYKNIEEIKKKNKEIGHQWFDKDTMEFWESKIESPVIYGQYFITSEITSPMSEKRAYSIRRADKNGSIETIGKFNGYKTQRDAVLALKEFFLKGDDE